MNEKLKIACEKFECQLVDDIEALAKSAALWNPSTWTRPQWGWLQDLNLGTGHDTYDSQGAYNKSRQAAPGATPPPKPASAPAFQTPKPQADTLSNQQAANASAGAAIGGRAKRQGFGANKPGSFTPSTGPNDPNLDSSVSDETK